MKDINQEINISKTDDVKNYINDLLINNQLSKEYFDIIYSKKIKKEKYMILNNNINNINNILNASTNNKGLLEIKNYDNYFGFLFENDNDKINIFYCLDVYGFEKIENLQGINSNYYYEKYLKSFGIPLDLISFLTSDNITLSYEEKKIEITNENISLNYNSNLKKNFFKLIELPNIMFYLLPLKEIKKVKDLLKNKKNEKDFNYIKDKIKY